MRQFIAAAALCALAACATAPSGPAPGGWSYAYDASAGLATATLVESGGSVAVKFTCRPPSGDLTIQDYTLRGGEATITIGSYSTNADAQSGGPLTLAFPQSPPLLAAAAQPSAQISIRAGGRTHMLADGAGTKLREVANACWPQGN